MVQSIAATYASVSYATQTTSLSLSSQQNKVGADGSAPSGTSSDKSGFSLGYTTTTTVATISLLYVQETGNSSKIGNDGHDDHGNGGDGDKDDKSALQSVLAGPSDPTTPLTSAAPVQSPALDILQSALQSFQSSDQSDDGGDNNKKDDKSAQQTVLAGPTAPNNPLTSTAPVQSSALDIIGNALQSFQSSDQGNGLGNAFGYAARDNNQGHTQQGILASYSVEVRTSSVAVSLTV